MHLFKGQGRTTTNLFFDSKPQFSDRVDISVYVTTYEMSMKDLHVMLCCHLADTCSIHDATAMRIVNSCYEWQSLKGRREGRQYQAIHVFVL